MVANRSYHLPVLVSSPAEFHQSAAIAKQLGDCEMTPALLTRYTHLFLQGLEV